MDPPLPPPPLLPSIVCLLKNACVNSHILQTIIISLTHTQSQLLLFLFAVLLDNKILLITGSDENSEQAEVLDLVAKESKVLPSTFFIPEKIFGATGGVIHGIPFIIGGKGKDSPYKGSKKCRKLTSEGWQTFAHLKYARDDPASVVLQDNQIWVTGGYGDSFPGCAQIRVTSIFCSVAQTQPVVQKILKLSLKAYA